MEFFKMKLRPQSMSSHQGLLPLLVSYFSIYTTSSKNVSKLSQMLVAHACNPSYSGGRDQDDHGVQPTWANSL
jgi:hypothetical protein